MASLQHLACRTTAGLGGRVVIEVGRFKMFRLSLLRQMTVAISKPRIPLPKVAIGDQRVEVFLLAERERIR